MDLDIGTLVAVLKLTNELTPALMDIGKDVNSFKEVAEEATGQTNLLGSAVGATADVIPQFSQVTKAAATEQALLSGALTETALAETAFSVAAIKSADSSTVAKKMMAELTAEAEANLPATTGVVAAHTELAAVLNVASLAWEAVAVPLGLVTIAVAAFGPKLWEMAGGWDGVTAAAREAWSVLGDLGVILEAIGGHILFSVVEGVTATFNALSTLGGAAVDAVKWFGDLVGLWDSIGATYGAVRDGIHAIAGAISVANAEIAQIPTGFQGTSLSFGIDPTDAAAVAALTAELDKQIAAQMRLNDPLRANFEEFSKQEGVISQKLTPAMAAALGITLPTTEAQHKLKDASKMTYDEMLRWGGSSVISGGIEDVMLASHDLTDELTRMGATQSLIVAPGIQSMNASLTEGGSAVANLIPSTNLLTSSLMALPTQQVSQDVSQVVVHFANWQGMVHDLSLSFLQLGQIIPGTTGAVLTFIGSALQGFLTLRSAITTFTDSFHQMQAGMSQGFSLSGITGVVGGISGMIGAVATAIQMFSALGSAIKRAFNSEETNDVSPNRGIFYDQFLGADTDPYTALGNSMIRAAMQVYGVDWTTAFDQYVDPLIIQMQDADTYQKFYAAELAIGELFKKAGITIDIVNKEGFATPYQSSVFDTQSYSQSYLPTITPTTDLATLQTQFTQQTQNSITGSYGSTYGNTTFQSGSVPSIGGGSGPCIYVQNLYVNGSTGQQQAQSFLTQMLNLISSGGEGMQQFRDVVCAAGAA